MYSQIDSNKRNSFLLAFVFVAIIAAIGYFASWFYGGKEFAYSGVAFALILSLIFAFVSYFSGDKIALMASGAKKVEREQNKYLYNLVENLCIAAGAPAPKIYIINDAAINAFATGRKPELASIAVTTGAIEKLENEELEGVLAHELSHIKNYDIRFMMLVAVLVGVVAILSDLFLRMSFGRRSNNDRGGGGHPAILIIGVIFILLSPLISELIKLAISRRREYLADASGALLTRYPEGLARALEKISAENRPMSRASTATAHLFIASPFGASKWRAFFSTHPPVGDRIKKLREMAR